MKAPLTIWQRAAKTMLPSLFCYEAIDGYPVWGLSIDLFGGTGKIR
jgi:hypothetical protein